MRTLENNAALIALKREFGRRECERIMKRVNEEKAKKAKLVKAVKNLFSPAPVLRFS